MTCRPLDPQRCPCGLPLDMGVDHGDDERGNPICSACCTDCNERNPMTPEQRLTADEVEDREWADDAVLVDKDGDPYIRLNGEWRGETTDILETFEPFRVIFDPSAAPESDHLMCARPERRVPQAADGNRWKLLHPNGSSDYHDDHWFKQRGYAIPEPESTVVERAAKVLAGTPVGEATTYAVLAQALAAAGLLKDDDQ